MTSRRMSLVGHVIFRGAEGMMDRVLWDGGKIGKASVLKTYE